MTKQVCVDNEELERLEHPLDKDQKLVIVHKGKEGTDLDGIPIDAFDVYAITTEYSQDSLSYLTGLVANAFDYDTNEQGQILMRGMNYDKAHEIKSTISKALTGDYKSMDYKRI